MKEKYSCKICGRPNPDMLIEKGEQPDFKEYLFWSKEDVIEHIKKEHPEIAKECSKPQT